MDGPTRRDVLKAAGAAGAAALVLDPRGAAEAAAPPAIASHREATGVFIPPRGASFMKFSFDAPEPAVRFAGFELGFTIFSRENAYHLDERKPKLFHYDALLELIPLYHVHAPHAVLFARFFSHLSHPAPGRGSSGVHESGFSPFDPTTLSLPVRPGLIPTLTVVDDTFTAHRAEMAAVIRQARVRAGLGLNR